MAACLLFGFEGGRPVGRWQEESTTSSGGRSSGSTQKEESLATEDSFDVSGAHKTAFMVVGLEIGSYTA